MYALFERLIDPLPNRRATRPPTNTAKFIWHYIAPVKGVLSLTLLLAGVSAACELYLYAYLGYLVDWMSNTSRGDFFATHARSLAVMFVVGCLIRPLTLIASRCLINLAISPGLVNSTRWMNHRYVLRQSMTFFQNDFAGRISQKVMQTGHALREIVINVIDGVWLLLIYLVGISALLLQIDSVLMLPIILWTVGYLAVVVFLVPPVRHKSASLSEATSGVTGRVVDSYTNIQSVKLFAHHRLEEQFAATAMSRHVRAFQVLMRAVLNLTVVLTVLNTFLLLLMASLSIWLWMNASVSVGEIAIANGLVIRLNQMSGWILRTITSLFENFGMIENGIETISQATQIIDQKNAPELVVDKGELRFDKVSFYYDQTNVNTTEPISSEKHMSVLPLIDGCSLTIKAGEKVGLVGRSGAGKSTLINLLMRFHDVQEGRISIDGQDISQVTQRSLRSKIAVVTQDTSLLHRSVRDNIRYGNETASDEQIVSAATQAEAMMFIPDLQDAQGRNGLDATVGERGVKLSGGQRQRIAIARVILKDAPILILDEATSALDSEVEAAIQQQLNTLMHGKTVLAVAHRLSTIAALDRLVVLDDGKIIETGSHDELLKTGGLYAQLWERQSGGFLGI